MHGKVQTIVVVSDVTILMLVLVFGFGTQHVIKAFEGGISLPFSNKIIAKNITDVLNNKTLVALGIPDRLPSIQMYKKMISMSDPEQRKKMDADPSVSNDPSYRYARQKLSETFDLNCPVALENGGIQCMKLK